MRVPLNITQYVCCIVSIAFKYSKWKLRIFYRILPFFVTAFNTYIRFVLFVNVVCFVYMRLYLPMLNRVLSYLALFHFLWIAYVLCSILFQFVVFSVLNTFFVVCVSRVFSSCEAFCAHICSFYVDVFVSRLFFLIYYFFRYEFSSHLVALRNT